MMDNEHQSVQEALGAYVLNALDAAEQDAITRHLETCEACTVLFTEVKTIVGVLPYSLPFQSPAPEMKTRLLAAARRERHTSPLPLPPPHTPTAWESFLAALRPLRWGVATALLLLLLLWNLYLQQQLGALQGTSGIADLADMPAEAVIPLVGTGHAEATARLYVTENLQEGILAVRGLPPLPSDRTYQLWFARHDNPTRTGGVFLVNEQGEALVEISLPYPLEVVSAIAITEEAAPHSESPTGEHLLDAIDMEP